MSCVGDITTAKSLNRRCTNKFIWARCPHCGYERWVENIYFHKQKLQGLCQACSHIDPITNHGHNWKGGYYKRPDGYINVRLGANDFFSSMADIHGQVLEHRLVMAKHLSRCLLPWEVIHHKNGNKSDNCIENLELLPTQKQHLVDIQTKRYIKQLKKRIQQLEARLN